MMFKRFGWVFLAMIPVGSIAGLLVAAVVTYVMPRKYESQAVIEIRPEAATQITPQFLGTEFEKIKNRESLGRVIDNLELASKWKWGVDKETANQILKSIITTENLRGTDLISLRVRHTNREDARDIAREVTQAYRYSWREIVNRNRKFVSDEGMKAIREQEAEVENSRQILNSVPEIQDPSVEESQFYRNARDRFDTERKLLEILELKLIGDPMPLEGIVIHEEPQIPQTPVSPNVTLNLVLGTALGVLLSPLLSLPVILLLNRLIPARTSL